MRLCNCENGTVLLFARNVMHAFRRHADWFDQPFPVVFHIAGVIVVVHENPFREPGRCVHLDLTVKTGHIVIQFENTQSGSRASAGVEIRTQSTSSKSNIDPWRCHHRTSLASNHHWYRQMAIKDRRTITNVLFAPEKPTFQAIIASAFLRIARLFPPMKTRQKTATYGLAYSLMTKQQGYRNSFPQYKWRRQLFEKYVYMVLTCFHLSAYTVVKAGELPILNRQWWLWDGSQTV